ncbi:prephenate dehydrogenase dimerization domain-containing protein [Rhodococcus sp. NPDC058505]|uniref:prephenate dehydrogenase dimerization domain-containing protein n=1 Tax=unclassified Rhodococcus (in: high G+C Gram-positive bacteria) TaxID=192944 RepID=UPI00364FBC9F
MTGPAAGRTVVVAGGAGAVGALLARSWTGDGASVVAVDVRDGPGGDIRRPPPPVQRLIRSADVLVLAVPEGVALAAAASVAPLLRPGSVLVETLSVKSRFADRVDSLPWGDGVAVLGINPMFAPSLAMPGRPVAAVIHRGGGAADTVLAELRSWGARVRPTTADRHDRVCAAMQALTHAAVLSFGLALADLGVDADETAALAPPPFAVLSALLARITGGTAEVYRDVQVANPGAAAAREALARAVSRLSAAAAADPGDFAGLLADAGAPLADHAAGYADLCARLFEGTVR